MCRYSLIYMMSVLPTYPLLETMLAAQKKISLEIFGARPLTSNSVWQPKSQKSRKMQSYVQWVLLWMESIKKNLLMICCLTLAIGTIRVNNMSVENEIEYAAWLDHSVYWLWASLLLVPYTSTSLLSAAKLKFASGKLFLAFSISNHLSPTRPRSRYSDNINYNKLDRGSIRSSPRFLFLKENILPIGQLYDTNYCLQQYI